MFILREVFFWFKKSVVNKNAKSIDNLIAALKFEIIIKSSFCLKKNNTDTPPNLEGMLKYLHIWCSMRTALKLNNYTGVLTCNIKLTSALIIIRVWVR